EKLDQAHGSIFDAEPEALRQEVAAVVQGPQPPLTSRLMDGFGLAILQAPERENGRAVWLYFGRNTGHGHLDRLNLGLYAQNIDMLPDLGSPEYASGRPRDIAWTRNNAAHAVPTVGGTPHSGGTPHAMQERHRAGNPYPTMQRRHRMGAPSRADGAAQ